MCHNIRNEGRTIFIFDGSMQMQYVCEALICKKALSVKIIGPLSAKALKCKKFGWPLSIIGLICKNDIGCNVLVQVHWHQRRD